LAIGIIKTIRLLVFMKTSRCEINSSDAELNH
jgi:hypothetical protein